MASTKPWTPAPGRHKVNIGSSLGRALKVRKGNPPPQKRSNLPDRDFYALRYNFKPSSIDTTKSGNMEIKKNREGNSNIHVEHPAQPNGFHLYRGREDPAKEWACVLIFDEETGSYTLEKIESFVALEHVERRADSVIAAARPTTSSNNERSLPQVVEDQQHEADIDLDSILEELVDSSRQATKDEPDSEEDVPIQHTLPPRPPTLPPKPAKPSTSKAKARTAPVEPPAPPPVTSSAPVLANKSKKASKRPTPEFSDVEEEPLDSKPIKRNRPSPPSPQPPQPPPVSKPPPQPKRAPPRKPSPPAKPRVTLELPGSSNSVIAPPVPSSSTSRQPPVEATPTAPPVLAALPVEPPAPVSAASDSEEDEWDEVAAPEGVSDMITMIEETGEEDENEIENDGGVEIDMDEFENLMKEHLREEENGNAEDEDDRYEIFPNSPELQAQEFAPVPPLPRSGGGPISLNAFAGGGGDHDDDDEYSSSEESDDE